MEELAFPTLLGNTYIKTIKIGGNFCAKLSIPTDSFVRIVGARTSSAQSNEITIVAEAKKKVIYARTEPNARIDELGNIYLGFAGNLDTDGGTWNRGILISDVPISVELIPKENKDTVIAYDVLPAFLI